MMHELNSWILESIMMYSKSLKSDNTAWTAYLNLYCKHMPQRHFFPMARLVSTLCSCNIYETSTNINEVTQAIIMKHSSDSAYQQSDELGPVVQNLTKLLANMTFKFLS